LVVQITSYNHCLQAINSNTNEGDFIQINGCLGITGVNGLNFQVKSIIDANNFTIQATITGSYLGLGTYSRLSQPIIQTKEFPLFWNEGRQIRVGAQKYLFDKTDRGQVTLEIFLSQNLDQAWNNPVNAGTPTNALIYSQVLYTCPEDTNLGLTAWNVNLQNQIAPTSSQIWHRVNTSLQGDTFSLGITLNTAQMLDPIISTSEIALHAIQVNVGKGPLLA